ncbi:MAG: 50S ribosomal protein L21 [Clostridiales bacterium]|jgi:large subunit ribosomal protein L21|nr:50S ribosomal protein L21 [Clostridiales bacterium]MDD6873661.1 50S ribosomal protein L21 [Clostridiales bacterium]MDD7368360.1 50S ribosomal protein L21 [Clostridiales bacterium]MDY2872954.1 50S ribosomal protein L21 [Eubacteriales bacterium]
MYAVIKTGGKQYRVQKDDVIYVEKLDAKEGDAVNFEVLMLGKDDGVVIGTPVVEGAKVEGEVLGQVKSAKVVVYKYKSKKNERRKQGHRQPYTKVKITEIG